MGLIFDGVDLEIAYGVVVSGAGSWAKPQRDRELVHVPGRNGDLIYDNGSWLNIEIPYSLYFREGWRYKYEEFCEWLCSHLGYFRLEDPDRHPGVYRMAEFAGPLDPKKWLLSDDGIVTVTFNCKPQQWLLEGETPIELELNPFVSGCFLNDAWNYNEQNGVATPLVSMVSVDDVTIFAKNLSAETAHIFLGSGEYDSADGIPHDIFVTEASLSSMEKESIGVAETTSQNKFSRLSVYSENGFDNLDIYALIHFRGGGRSDYKKYDLSSSQVGKGVKNETRYNALPTITVEPLADTKIKINDFEISVTGYSGDERIIIDCDTEDCYLENTYENANQFVSIKNKNEKELKDFPYLVAGNNVIGPYQVGETATLSLVEENPNLVKIKPNWYKI